MAKLKYKHLYVWTAASKKNPRGCLDTYRYTDGTSIAAGVQTVTLYGAGGAKSQPVVVVFKRKKSFPYDGTAGGAAKTIAKIVAGGESVVFREHALQAFLLKKEPQHIARLVFPGENQYAYIKRAKSVVPVKVTYYYDATCTLMSNAARVATEKRILKALCGYYGSRTDARARDDDWKHPRNMLHSKQGRCVYHDFDWSV